LSLQFAQFIRTKRLEKNIGVMELAYRAGVSRAFIYLLESGQNGVTLKTAERILMALGESWESLINTETQSK
jgi:predicted transcriptional regulator